MNELYLYFFLALFFGVCVFFISRTIWLISSSKRVDTFLGSSPKGQAWVQKLGFEKAKKYLYASSILALLFSIAFSAVALFFYLIISGRYVIS